MKKFKITAHKTFKQTKIASKLDPLTAKTIGFALLAILLFSLSSMLSVQAATSSFSGSVFIKGDGSIDPSTAPIQRSGETYTLLESFVGNITIQKDNVVIDGAGYSIESAPVGTETTVGIEISFRNNVKVTNIQIQGFVNGVHLVNSTNCNLIGNNITANVDGIRIDNSTSNFIIANNITSNRHGTHPFQGNTFYHNNFLNSSDKHVFFDFPNYTDVWDDGYPSGGNHWSNYTGIDEKKGPNQDEAGSDGIGDTPHTIDVSGIDQYPLMAPFNYGIQPSSEPISLFLVYLIAGAVVIVVVAIVGFALFRRKTKTKS